ATMTQLPYSVVSLHSNAYSYVTVISSTWLRPEWNLVLFPNVPHLDYYDAVRNHREAAPGDRLLEADVIAQTVDFNSARIIAATFMNRKCSRNSEVTMQIGTPLQPISPCTAGPTSVDDVSDHSRKRGLPADATHDVPTSVSLLHVERTSTDRHCTASVCQELTEPHVESWSTGARQLEPTVGKRMTRTIGTNTPMAESFTTNSNSDFVQSSHLIQRLLADLTEVKEEMTDIRETQTYVVNELKSIFAHIKLLSDEIRRSGITTLPRELPPPDTTVDE
ncbi:unnamed protein product, partial [Dicrocoelium dendriticum]